MEKLQFNDKWFCYPTGERAQAFSVTLPHGAMLLDAVLMASAAVWSANLMVNQIGYVISGLDGIDTIMSFIVFCALAVISMLLNIIASFLPMAKDSITVTER